MAAMNGFRSRPPKLIVLTPAPSDHTGTLSPGSMLTVAPAPVVTVAVFYFLFLYGLRIPLPHLIAF